VVTGIVILLYSYLGGVWAVSTTDVVQGVILLGITLIIMPLAVSNAGGLGALIRVVPPLSFDHTYNGVHYTEHWLVGILLISVIGYAGGQGQRFFSVVDERAAKRVGRFAALLALSVPLVFGLPPLAARVLWPDLAQVPWFQLHGGKNPQDLVFVAMCLKILPNGLIGVFVAAMLAATMSTLSAVYNMISSVYARDIHPTLTRRTTDDTGLLRLGRLATLGIGLIVLGLAMMFINSSMGIFNLMQAFFTLFNIPVTVPLAFGLLNRRVPKWSAVGAVVWGLLTGVCTRHVLAWDIGPQVYASLIMTLGMYLASPSLARIYREKRALLYAIATAAAVISAVVFIVGATHPIGAWQQLAVWQLAVTTGCCLLLGASTISLARLFGMDTEAENAELAGFFRKLDTPIDVEREVRSSGKHFVSTLPFIGGTVVFMGALMSLIFMAPMSGTERLIVGCIIAVLLATGAAIIVAGLRVRRAEQRGFQEG
jgi:Na+/proline symporter